MGVKATTTAPHCVAATAAVAATMEETARLILFSCGVLTLNIQANPSAAFGPSRDRRSWAAKAETRARSHCGAFGARCWCPRKSPLLRMDVERLERLSRQAMQRVPVSVSNYHTKIVVPRTGAELDAERSLCCTKQQRTCGSATVRFAHCSRGAFAVWMPRSALAGRWLLLREQKIKRDLREALVSIGSKKISRKCWREGVDTAAST